MATSIDAYLAANGLPQGYPTAPSYGANYVANSQPIQTVDPSQVAPPQPMPAPAPQAAPQGYDPSQQGAPPPQPVNALANPGAAAQPSSGPTQAMVDAAIQAQHHKGFRDIVGGLGDALAAFGGYAPTYAPIHQQRILQRSFADWQANPDDPTAQANFLAASPQDAFNFMQQRRQNQLASMKAQMDLQATQRANAQAAVGRAATILKGVRDQGGDVGMAYDQLRASGQLDPIGMHPGEHDYYRDMIVKTPGVLDQLAAPPKTVVVPGGEGAPGTLVNEATGATVARGQPGYVKLAPGEGLFPAGGGQPASNDPTAPAAGSPSTPNGNLSIVSGNNHGAIKDGAYAKSQPGYTGSDANGFATFKTPGAGIAAQENLLRTSYLGRGVNTVSAIVDKYAPAGPENSTASRAAYKSYVAQQLGVAPDAPISGQQLRPLAAAMRNFETGAMGSTPVTSPGSIARGATAPIPAGAAAYNSSGELTPEAQQQAAEQYILTGAIPAGLGRNGMSQKQIIDAAAGLGYTPGQIAAIRARNTADTGSLGALENQATLVRSAEGAAEKNANLVLSLAPKVGNGSVPLFNTWKNTAAEHRGQGPIAGLNTAIGTFVNQYATVMGKGTPTEGLRHEGAEMIHSSQSPDQLATVVKTMQTDMSNMRQSYEDERQRTSSRLAGGLPKPVATPQDAAALPKGTRFITPDGRFGTR